MKTIFNENLVEGEKKVPNIEIDGKGINRRPLLNNNLGEGERSTFILHKKFKNSTIVSDDNTFINFLRNEKANFIISAEFITLLKALNKIKSEKAEMHLDNMKPYIKPKVYLRIKNNIGGAK